MLTPPTKSKEPAEDHACAEVCLGPCSTPHTAAPHLPCPPPPHSLTRAGDQPHLQNGRRRCGPSPPNPNSFPAACAASLDRGAGHVALAAAFGQLGVTVSSAGACAESVGPRDWTRTSPERSRNSPHLLLPLPPRDPIRLP